jgi:hypothetical protein
MKFDDMQGILVLDLKGDGSRDIVVDNEALCGSRLAAANCSNRGCDVAIYKDAPRGQWRKLFLTGTSTISISPSIGRKCGCN